MSRPTDRSWPNREDEPLSGFYGAEEAGIRRSVDDEIWSFIDRYLEQHGGGRERLIPLLHRIQEKIGHLPFEVQEYVADGIGLAPVQVYGVVSFYHGFTTTPRARHQLKVCMGTACFAGRSQHVLDALAESCRAAPGGISDDGLFNLDAVRCMGACALAPAIMVGSAVHGNATPRKARRIVNDLRDRAGESAGESGE
jgi:NADH:ubiquinone oxidoreductase subunit E